jgi:hypothetical protein
MTPPFADCGADTVRLRIAHWSHSDECLKESKSDPSAGLPGRFVWRQNLRRESMSQILRDTKTDAHPPTTIIGTWTIGERIAGLKASSLLRSARQQLFMPFNILDTFPERHGDYSKGQKNDFRDAEAIAEAVQCPTMKFVATKDRRSARPAGAAPRA